MLLPRRKHQRKHSNREAGWATLELIMTFPIVMLLLYSILYIGQYTLARLQLMSLVDSLARQAAIKGCDTVDASLHGHLPANLIFKSKSCAAPPEALISLSVETEFNSPLPIPILPKTVKSESFAWNELE